MFVGTTIVGAAGVGVSLTDGEVTGVVVVVLAGAELLDVFVPGEVGLGSNEGFTREFRRLQIQTQLLRTLLLGPPLRPSSRFPDPRIRTCVR